MNLDFFYGAFLSLMCFRYVVEKNNVNILLSISFCAPWNKENLNVNVITWWQFCRSWQHLIFPTGDASRPGWTDIITTVTVAKMAHFRIVNCWNRKSPSANWIWHHHNAIYCWRTPLLTFRPRHTYRQYVCLRKSPIFDAAASVSLKTSF